MKECLVCGERKRFLTPHAFRHLMKRIIGGEIVEKEDMMLILLVIVVAIAALQAFVVFGMYSEAGQIKTALGPQLQTGISGMAAGQATPQVQGLGGC